MVTERWTAITHAAIAALEAGNDAALGELLESRESLLPRMRSATAEARALESRLETLALARREALAAELRRLGASRRQAARFDI